MSLSRKRSITMNSMRASSQRAPNLAMERSRALAASTSRLRGGACVTIERISSRAVSATFSTAASKAASLAFDGTVKPLSLRTNCSDASRISSSVAGGSKLNKVLMFLHMALHLQLDLGLDLHRDVEWQLGHADGTARMRACLRPPQLENQVGEAIDHRRLPVETGRRVDHAEHAMPLAHPIEVAERALQAAEDAQPDGA